MEQIPSIIHESWHKHLQPLFDDPKMNLIKSEILPKCNFYPSSSNIFRVFSMPLNQIKVVILGQDPYPNGEAIGYAFAVNSNTSIPKSLHVIFKEIIQPETSEDYVKKSLNKDKELKNWVNEGVFLLNTALTVEAKKAGSHLGYWQWFTREVIKIISKEQPCIWLLWGAKAQSYKDYIFNSMLMFNKQSLKEYEVEVGEYIYGKNIILEAPHPAAELYSGGTGKTFSGSNHFNLVNDILTAKQNKLINW